MINKELLEYICCPKCKADLIEKDNLLVCEKCEKEYKIEDGIPILVDLDNLPKHFQKQIRYFKNESKTYPDYKLSEWQKSYIRRLEQNFILEKENILLDIGTGSGYVAVEMAKRGFKVIACDLTLMYLVRLKNIIKTKGLHENCFLICCSAEDLPFKDKIADYLVANAILEHLPNENKVIEEINRVSAEKSKLMITVPVSYKHLNPLFIPINFIHDKKIGHLRRYDYDYFKNKFDRFGFRITNVFYTGHFLKTLGVILSILLKIHKFDKKLEEWDNKKMKQQRGASNMIVFLERND